MPWTPDATDRLCVTALRTLAIDAVEAANSGHPGLPLGAAPMACVLWQRHLKHDPQDPHWPDRDRFVLSAGHGSMLLYGLLHLSGYDLPLDEIKRFRQWESRTPGHPEFGVTPGVEATTGPLGQGTAVSVGMALAERALAGRFNRPGHPLVDHFTYALVSDGDLMEGIAAEAASLAGHHGLGKLVWLYDANDISLDGPTSVTFTEDVAARFAAYGWHVQKVADGDTDLTAIDAALVQARAELGRPSLIIVRTTIGYGSPGKQGTHHAHGAPLGADEVKKVKVAFGVDPEAKFAVPAEARERWHTSGTTGAQARKRWMQLLATYEAAHAGDAAEFRRRVTRELPLGWDDGLPSFEPGGKQLATREASGVALNALAARLPELLSIDADLSSSTKSRIDGAPDLDGRSGAGRNLRAGVREHAMGAIANGICYHGGLRPFTATFLAFSDYMRTPMRLAALDKLRATFVFTHDSLAVGEDGPTHEPVEQVAALRVIPNLAVVRPADPNETVAGWRFAIARDAGPVAMILTRQKVPTLAGTAALAAEGVARGAYVLADAPDPAAIVIASGSEVQLAIAAKETLAAEGIAVRVVSMPCMEQFDAQDRGYRDSVLLPGVPRVAVEAGVPMPWYRWAGDNGIVLGVERFGASAPGETVLKEFGFTPEHVAATVRSLFGR